MKINIAIKLIKKWEKIELKKNKGIFLEFSAIHTLELFRFYNVELLSNNCKYRLILEKF